MPTGQSIEKSIAVIPFKNLSDDKENQYFVDGIMDEIRNKLSKIKKLRVISRTSVEQYRNTKKSIGEIGKELGVAYILEGSAQKYGDQIKLLLELIHTETENQIWSGDYTRSYQRNFALQSEIATAIAAGLQAKLSPLENELINNVPEPNLDAYDFYLRGKQFLLEYGRTGDEKNSYSTRSMFHRALNIDSRFARAWVGLGMEYQGRNWNAPEYLKDNYLDSVLNYCNRAISLDPNLAEAYKTRGEYYFSRNKFQSATADAEEAIAS